MTYISTFLVRSGTSFQNNSRRSIHGISFLSAALFAVVLNVNLAVAQSPNAALKIVALINGFLPVNGNSFSVMTFASRSGDFTVKNGLDLSGGLRLDPVYTATAFNLNVTDQPTLIALSKFEATRYETGALLEWETGLEVRNLGFRIYRQEGGTRELLNKEIVAGSALVAGSGTMFTAGRSYAYWVEGKDAGKDAAFWLEDIDLNGQTRWHGPVIAKQVGGKLPQRSLAESLSQVGTELADATHPVAPSAGFPTSSRSGETAASLEQASLASSRAVKIGVRKAGWYRVTQAELNGAGLDPKIDPRSLRMFVDGVELPILVSGEEDGSFDTGDTVEFYGLGLNTASTDKRVYWLIWGSQPGLRISKAAEAKGNPTGQCFPYTVERRDRTIYFAALRNGDEENFFGPVISSSAIEQRLTVKNIDQSAKEAAILEISVQGVTNLAHQVSVKLNGTQIGQVSYNGQSKGREKIGVPESLLHEGENVVSLQSVNGASDISLVDWIRTTYQHSYRADNDSLSFAGTAGQEVSIGGFATKDIRVLDVTDERNVQEVVGVVDQGKDGYSITIVVPGASKVGPVGGGVPSERKLIALVNGGAEVAASIKANTPSHLREASNGADMIIISSADLFESLKPLVSLRTEQGLKTNLIDIEDVYDEFTFGDKTPQAIRDFLGYAMKSWKVKPRFVLIAGEGSYDPKNYLEFGDSDLVPTKLIDTEFMETASDDWMTDFDGDGIADMATGRLPARTADELATMVSKIVGYERETASDEVLLVSDANDGFDFEKESGELTTLIPVNLRITQVNRGRVDPEKAKGSLIEGINRRQFLVNYNGHGSANQWRGGLLTNQDAIGLRNEHLPMFVMMTCLNGYFHDPGEDSLGEALMKAEGGGAVAVWASSGMTVPRDQALVNKALYRSLFNRGGAVTIGEAVIRAKTSVSNLDIRRTWVLLGDPSMRLR